MNKIYELELENMTTEKKTKEEKPNCKKRLSSFKKTIKEKELEDNNCLLYTSPSPRDRTRYRMPSSA